MKIRNGFVSNSSSSSFVVYGISLSTEKLDDILVKNLDKFKKHWESPDLTKEELLEDKWEAFYCLDVLIGLEVTSNGNGYYYVGRSWQTIGDDETGREFKNGVEDKLSTFGIDETPHHIDIVEHC